MSSNNCSKQRGMTYVNILALLILFGFFMMLFLKIGPIYVENMKVQSGMDTLMEEPGITKKNTRAIKDLLQRRFEIDMIESINTDKVDVFLEGKTLIVETKYEVRKHLFANVAVVISFENIAESE